MQLLQETLPTQRLLKPYMHFSRTVWQISLPGTVAALDPVLINQRISEGFHVTEAEASERN